MIVMNTARGVVPEGPVGAEVVVEAILEVGHSLMVEVSNFSLTVNTNINNICKEGKIKVNQMIKEDGCHPLLTVKRKSCNA